MNIYDIAAKAGVSIATVSRVLNNSDSVKEETRAKVTRVLNEMGYTPNVFARGLMTDSMKTIGVMTIDVRDLYYANAIHTIEFEMRRKGYDVILYNPGEDIREKKTHLKLLLQKRVDGIILIGSVFKEKTDNSHIIEAAAKVPIVLINGLVEADNVYSVLCDDSHAIQSAVDYLYAKGHRDFLYLYEADTYSGMQKIDGFKRGLAKYGLEASRDRMIKTAKGIEGGYEGITKAVADGIAFSAAITAEDIIAAGVLKKLAALGRKVPEDTAVVGFNDSIIARCTTPELTSVDNKVSAISSTAVKLLEDAFAKKNIPSRTVISSELVIRSTT